MPHLKPSPAAGLVLAMVLSLVPLSASPPAGAAQPAPPSSAALIAAAVRRGNLDPETALVYRVYALFDPARLPPAYRSPTPARSATSVLVELARSWDRLAPRHRAELSAWLLPPLQRSAAQQQRPALPAEQTAGTPHFVVHYTLTGTHAVYNPGVDVDPANGLPDYVDWVTEAVETGWSTQVGALGWLAPPPDVGEGGDARYDVYLQNLPGYYGYTDFAGGCVGDNPNSPGVLETAACYSYIVLENDFRAVAGDRRDLIHVVSAHEFNHALQLGYDSSEAIWLMEASATWMEDEVYDEVNDNYQFLDKLFLEPDRALDVPDDWAYYYGYSRWLFVRYLSEHHGGPPTVRRIWEHAVAADGLTAVELALAGAGSPFAGAFTGFATANYALSSLPHNAPYTYEEAAGYRSTVGGVEIEAVLPFTGTAVTYDSFTMGNERLEQNGAEYWAVDAAANFALTFSGNPGIDYRVQGLLRRETAQGEQIIVRPISLSEQQGTLVVLDPATYDEIVLVVANVAGGDEQASYSLTISPTTETAPQAAFSAAPLPTNPLGFTFDASASHDLQTPAEALEVRWDWDGDALWDTSWSLAKTAVHTYTAAGTYTVSVEVRDGVGLSATASRTVSAALPPVDPYWCYLPLVQR